MDGCLYQVPVFSRRRLKDPLTRAFLVKEVIKHLMYIREQVPCAFEV